MDKKQPHPMFKLATELGPLLIFFFANAKFNLFVATGAFMVAIVVALASLGAGRAVRSDVAMTGEITLRGAVLPVGGIREKVLAAHRAGIRRVILPLRTEADLEDVPRELRDELEFVLLDRMEQVIAEALQPAPATAGVGSS